MSEVSFEIHRALLWNSRGFFETHTQSVEDRRQRRSRVCAHVLLEVLSVGLFLSVSRSLLSILGHLVSDAEVLALTHLCLSEVCHEPIDTSP